MASTDKISPFDLTYEQITEGYPCIDSMLHYERYDLGKEITRWVCVDCETVDADPYEQNCACYDIDHDGGVQ